jgi:ubiquilin
MENDKKVEESNESTAPNQTDAPTTIPNTDKEVEKTTDNTDEKKEEPKSDEAASTSASASPPNDAKTIELTIKTPKEKETIHVSPDADVSQLKTEVSKKFNQPNDRLCMIFAGKILKDQDTLTQHGIKDGVTVHLVIKMKPGEAKPAATTTTGSTSTTTTTTTTTAPTSTQTSNPATAPLTNNLFDLGNLSSLGFGNANFAEMQSQMQQQVMRDPQMLNQMLDNPMVQSLMSNPDVIREMMMSNPQMQSLMERNPEIQHMLNNPSLMRETMQLARNPAALQELMRNHDRALSNLESVPGGFNALQRLYQEVEEPMMNATRDQFSQNPFAALAGNNSNTSQSQQAGTENTQPLPNPWGPRPTTTTTTTSSSNTSTTQQQPAISQTAMNNILSQLMAGNNANTTSTSTTTTTGTTTGTTTNTSQNPLGSNIEQTLRQQMLNNPRQLASMMNAPHMQQMLQMLGSNPEMARHYIESNPFMAQNPEMREQALRSMPQMMQQMQNPQFRELLSNPDALQAMMQIQQGIEQLQTASPNSDFLSGLGYPSGGLGGLGGLGSLGGTGMTGSTGSTGPSNNTAAPAMNAQFLSQMLSQMGDNSISQPPEQRFATQLNQLATMGFINRDANIQGNYSELFQFLK